MFCPDYPYKKHNITIQNITHLPTDYAPVKYKTVELYLAVPTSSFLTLKRGYSLYFNNYPVFSFVPLL